MARLASPQSPSTEYRCLLCDKAIEIVVYESSEPEADDGWRYLKSFRHGIRFPPAHTVNVVERHLKAAGIESPYRGRADEQVDAALISGDGAIPYELCDNCVLPLVELAQIEVELWGIPGRQLSDADVVRDAVAIQNVRRKNFVFEVPLADTFSMTAKACLGTLEGSKKSVIEWDLALSWLVQFCQRTSNQKLLSHSLLLPLLCMDREEFLVAETLDQSDNFIQTAPEYTIPMTPDDLANHDFRVALAAQTLVLFGADPNEVIEENGDTLLIRLVRENGPGEQYLASILVALHVGADPHHQNAEGECAADLAADLTASAIRSYEKLAAGADSVTKTTEERSAADQQKVDDAFDSIISTTVELAQNVFNEIVYPWAKCVERTGNGSISFSPPEAGISTECVVVFFAETSRLENDEELQAAHDMSQVYSEAFIEAFNFANSNHLALVGGDAQVFEKDEIGSWHSRECTILGMRHEPVPANSEYMASASYLRELAQIIFYQHVRFFGED